MPTKRAAKFTATTIAFDRFWRWLEAHPNCVVRASTPEATLFDHDGFHWTFATESDGALLVQVMLGKHPVGDLVVHPGDIAYVQAEPGHNEEFVFECISETQNERVPIYTFVLSHAFDEEDDDGGDKWTH